jgi:hypothetical protein
MNNKINILQEKRKIQKRLISFENSFDPIELR